MAAILPWPARAERKQSVERARIEAEHAWQKTEKSRGLVAELRRLREKNHVKEALDVIIQHHEHPGEGP